MSFESIADRIASKVRGSQYAILMIAYYLAKRADTEVAVVILRAASAAKSVLVGSEEDSMQREAEELVEIAKELECE